MPPFVIPSKKLPLLGTDAAAKVAYVRLANDGTVKSTETARLVQNDEAVTAQRSYVRSISERVEALFSGTEWMSHDEAEEDEFKENALLRLVRRAVPTAPDYDGIRLRTTVAGRRLFTPMVVVMVAIGTRPSFFALCFDISSITEAPSASRDMLAAQIVPSGL